MGRSGLGQPFEPPIWDMARYDFGSRQAGLTLYGFGEIGEEFVGQFLGRTVDQALAELGELAADLGLDVIAEQRAAILVGEPHDGAALGIAGHAALDLARTTVHVGRGALA